MNLVSGAIGGIVRAQPRKAAVWMATTAMVALAGIMPAMAQGGRAAEAAQAGVAGTRHFDIPAQSMATAINAFGVQSGLQLTAEGNVTAGVQASEVIGDYQPIEALVHLLSGTGLTWRKAGENIYVLVRAPQAAASAPQPAEAPIQLGPVTVQGNTLANHMGYLTGSSRAATKTDTPLIETPQSISVITREQIEDQGAHQSVAEALRYTPGLTPEPRGNVDRYEFLFARGFSIPSYLDGLILTGGHYAIPQIDPYFLDSIEAFRGPSSVLYGQNSPGGMVNLNTKLPTAVAFHEVELQAGNFGRIQGAFDAGGPINEQATLLYRVAGIGLTTGTQVDHTRTQRLGISPSLTWLPDDATSLTLIGNYQYDPRGGYLDIGLPANGTVRPNPNGRIPDSLFTSEPGYSSFTRTQASAGYQFEHHFGEAWSIRQNLRYQYVGATYQDLFSRGLAADQRTLNRATNPAHERLNSLGVDTQVEGHFQTGALRHTVLAGLDYKNSTWHDTEGFTAAGVPTLDVFNPVYGSVVPASPTILDQVQRISQIGLYGQDQIKFDRLSLLVGGRQDWVRNQTKNLLASSVTRSVPSAFTWRSGLVYTFDSGFAPYFSYSESFQPTSGTNFSGKPFEPTKGKQYELGLRFQPASPDVYLAVALYDLRQTNVLTLDVTHPTFSVQTGEVGSRGVEIEGRAALADGLSLIGSYTYLDNKVTRSNTATLGTHPAGIPKQTASLWVKYDLPDELARGFSLGAGVRHTDLSYGDNANTFKVSSYTVADALLKYDLAGLSSSLHGVELKLNVNNLFDSRYVSACYGTGSNCFYGTRRTVIGSVAYRW